MLFDCRPKVLHKHCLQFLLGVKMAPRETENNAYAKFWGDKQRTLWYVMVFLEWSMLQCPETQADRTETGNGAWKVSGTQGRGRPMNCFIYLFIYLSFFEPPPCLCNNCLFLLWQIYPWVLYNSHISLFPVPVLENSINERTWLVTHMTYLVLKKSFICLL